MRTPKATRTFLHAVKTHSDFGGDEVPTIVALLGPMKPYLSESRQEVAELRALDARYQQAFGHITVTAFAKLLRTLLSSTS